MNKLVNFNFNKDQSNFLEKKKPRGLFYDYICKIIFRIIHARNNISKLFLLLEKNGIGVVWNWSYMELEPTEIQNTKSSTSFLRKEIFQK